MFRNEAFSAWDEQGLPIQDAKGVEVGTAVEQGTCDSAYEILQVFAYIISNIVVMCSNFVVDMRLRCGSKR